jgi:two-component system LytT family response regulator
MIDPPVRALIVDDEPLARRTLSTLAARVPWLLCVGEANDGEKALTMASELKPELLFLDVQMPIVGGLDVVARLRSDIVVIFTTAFDEYAVSAFELGAIDYLRKPFGESRFIKAVTRAAQQVESFRNRAPTAAGAVPLGAPLRERLAFAESRTSPLQRIFVRDRGAAIPLDVSTIVRVEGDGDFAGVFSGGRRYLVHIKLRDLAGRLDSARFIRIHRSHIVNLDAVRSIVPVDPSRLEVRMDDGAAVIASRAGTKLLRQAMRLAPK